jgi:hypothetical protein
VVLWAACVASTPGAVNTLAVRFFTAYEFSLRKSDWTVRERSGSSFIS